MLTKQQLKLFMIIDESLKKDGVCPSFEEMKNLIGLKSKSGIHRLIKSLEERGFIRQIPNKARALEIIKYPENFSDNIKNLIPVNDNTKMITIPLYGKIAAGTPIAAIADTSESMEEIKERIAQERIDEISNKEDIKEDNIDDIKDDINDDINDDIKELFIEKNNKDKFFSFISSKKE